MSIPGNRGDELALHLLDIMSQIHYCVITKIYYSHLDAFSPSAVHIALVYLGNSIFRDTMTLAKKCPPPPCINLCEPLPGDLTPRESHLRNREQRRRLNTQEGGDQLDAQESPDPQDAQEKHKSPPHQTPPRPKKKSKKKVKVVHSKGYKIRQPKKGQFLRNALCVVNLLIHNWSLICTLSLCTSIDSCAALGNVAKHLVTWKLLKSTCLDMVR